MNEPDISIIIVNYESEDELLSCLSSLFKLQTTSRLEVIVINNSACNLEFERVMVLFPEIIFLSSKGNIGFSRANNIGVENSTAPYLLFLNPDTVLVEDCITPLMSCLKSKNLVGICAPMLVDSNMKYQASSGFKMGLLFEIFEAFFLLRFLRSIEKWKYIKRSSLNKPVKVDWLSGAFMMMDKKVYVQNGGFDPEYFLNYEDIDLCGRLEEKGYINYYFPFLKCIHKGLASQSKDYGKLVYSRYQSRLIYARKHYSYLIRLLVRIVHILGLIIRIIIVLFLRKSKENIQRMLGYKRSIRLYLKI